jgi:hypothetical protein
MVNIVRDRLRAVLLQSATDLRQVVRHRENLAVLVDRE